MRSGQWIDTFRALATAAALTDAAIARAIESGILALHLLTTRARTLLPGSAASLRPIARKSLPLFASQWNSLCVSGERRSDETSRLAVARPLVFRLVEAFVHV
jgi:hypothetical protein